MICEQSRFVILYRRKKLLLQQIERKVSNYVSLNIFCLENEKKTRKVKNTFVFSPKEYIRTFMFQKKKIEKDDIAKEKKINKIERGIEPLSINDINKIKNEDDPFFRNQADYCEISEHIIPQLCVKRGNKEQQTEKENVLNLLQMLLKEKESDFVFSSFYSFSKIYQEIIAKSTIENTELQDSVKRKIYSMITEGKFEFLFQYFEMLIIYKIHDDLRLFQKILFLIIKNQEYSEENKIIYCYYIMKYLYENKIYMKLVSNIINRYLLVQPFFWKFLQKFHQYENVFLLFCYYTICCNRKISYFILEKYTECFNNLMDRSFHLKYINGRKGVIAFQNLLLYDNFYSSKFNLIVKKYLEDYITLLNPGDVLLLSSNLFLSFTQCDYVLFENEKLETQAEKEKYKKKEKEKYKEKDQEKEKEAYITINDKNSRNKKSTTTINTDNNTVNIITTTNTTTTSTTTTTTTTTSSDTNNVNDCINILNEEKINKLQQIKNTVSEIKNKKRKYRNQKYLLFLSLKYLADKCIRTTDNFVSNLNNTEYILKYFILSSFCHFSLLSNWWADTSIYMKLKRKKKKLKKMRKSRVQDKNHFSEKITHLLEALMYQFGYYKKEQNNVTNIDSVSKKKSPINYLSDDTYDISLFEKKKNQTKAAYVFPYLLKSFVRASLGNSNLKYNEQFLFFFRDTFEHCINLSVIQYERTKEKLKRKNIIIDKEEEEEEEEEEEKAVTTTKEEKEEEEENKYQLSLYEVSSICESFFILQNLFQFTGSNIYTSDLFEKALYIYFNKIHFFFYKKHMDFHLLNENCVENILNKYVDVPDPIFNYYLLLKILLPIICDDKLKNYLSCTKQTVAKILAFPFSSTHLCEQIKEENDWNKLKELNIIITTIIENFKKWENSIISVNTQRRIRKQTKKKNYIFDFLYANEFIRPSFIYMVCLNRIIKEEDIYNYFLSCFNTLNNVEIKHTFVKFINQLYNSFDFRVRKSEKRKTKTLIRWHKVFVEACR